MSNFKIIAVALTFSILTGCAMIPETIKISTVPEGATIKTSTGKIGTSPMKVRKKRNGILLVKASKAGYESNSVTVLPTATFLGDLLGDWFWIGGIHSKPNPVKITLEKK
jgi:hypothetical protein